MRLFDDKARTALDVALQAETMMAYVDRSGRRVMAALRDVLEGWFERYPVEHRANLHGRLHSRRERDQRAAWWELYLHESFSRAGYAVQVSSATPDFTITGPTGRFHVEATARFESPEKLMREAREQALHDALDRTDCGPWGLWLAIHNTGRASAPAAKLRTRVEAWLRTLDFETVRAAGPQKNQNGFDHFPQCAFREDDWQVLVEALPVGLPDTTEQRRRVIWGSGHGEMMLVENEEPLRAAISRKVSVCRNLDAPLIIAVLVARDFGHEHQIESTLLGSDSVEYAFSPAQLEHPIKRNVRLRDGLWSGPDENGEVAGVLAGVRLDHFSFTEIAPTFWTNPHVQHTPLDLATDLPWHHRWVDAQRHLQAGAIPRPAAFFGLEPGWPGRD